MRRALALILALTASPALAQVRVAPELALPSPAIAPLKPVASAATIAAPSLAPSIAPALAPLALTGANLAAAARENRDAAPALARTFEAAASKPESPVAPAVAVPESAARPSSLLRAGEEPNSPRHRVVFDPRSPLKQAAHETIEVGALTIPFALAAWILRGVFSDPAVLIPAMIALWAAGAWAMRDHLAALRSTITGGWQASHDQKYRVDYNTGQLRDVRGQKYGSDRYEEWTNGPVGRRATAAIVAAAALAALASLLL